MLPSNFVAYSRVTGNNFRESIKVTETNNEKLERRLHSLSYDGRQNLQRMHTQAGS